MRVIDLALKDIRQLVRDWRAAIFLLAMPIGFTVMFGFAFGGRGGIEEGDPRLPVGLLDQDQGRLSPQLAALLASSQVIRIDEEAATGAAELEELVADGDLAATIVVPAGYSSELLAGQTPRLVLVTDPGSSAGSAVQGEVQSAATRLSSAVRAASLSSQIYDEQVGFADDGARQSYYEDQLAQGVAAWENPPVAFDTQKAFFEENPAEENAFAQSSPGMMAQFAVFGLLGAVTILVLERKSGSMKRMLTTDLSRGEILLGHYLAMVAMIFVQLFVLVIFGQLFLDLDYLSQPLATLLLIATASLMVAALGLLIGALAKSEEQVIVYSLIPMFILSGFGGAWVPLEVMPEAFGQIARLTPLAWVITGMQDVIIRGRGLEAIWLPALVLFGYAAVFFILGVWRFRIE
ncbi:MAG TPA: ABC transporter permease [Anaerolineae bacterium]|jgi:ABC-2 type transport system permease protein|nr:ABC transporter permease [Anaerolineae bacterium]